jgi:phage shock protein A
VDVHDDTETTTLPGKVELMGSSPQPPEQSDPPAAKSAAPESAEPAGSAEGQAESAAGQADPAAADYVDGVPTFDFVRDRIEGRYATAMGSTELAEESTAGRSLAQQEEDREAAARERLEQIRKSLRGE